MVFIVSLHSSLTHHYWACLVMFHFMLPCFFPDWSWIVLFLLMIQSFGLTGHGLYRFISCFTGSSLLGTVCIISLHASLIPHSLAWVCVVSFSSLAHHYCTWFIFFHCMLHCIVLTGHGLYCFTSFFPGSSSLGIVCIVSFNVSLHASLAIFTEHGLYCFTTCLSGSSLLGMVCIVSFNVSLVHHYWALFV